MSEPVFAQEQAVIFRGEIYKVLIYLKSEDVYLLRGYAFKVKESELKTYYDETTNGKTSSYPEGMDQ